MTPTAQRCYVPPAAWGATVLVPPADEAHHLLDVLRLREGDTVEVFDGAGRRGTARLAGGSGDTRCTLEPIQSAAAPPRSRQVTLVQAIPRGKRMDWLVEKATELGAAAIRPARTARVVTRPEGKAARKRRERWQTIARNAARQCGTPWLPEVAPIASYEAALDAAAGLDLLLVGSLGGTTRPLRDALRDGPAAHATTIGIIIGPEGDLTAAELAAARDRGAVPVSFGPLVLRVETAALFALSAVLYEFAPPRSG